MALFFFLLFRCPELNACISSTLWCDKTRHCPSGFDESDINCFQFTGAVLYIGLGGGLLILLTVLILCTSWCKYRQHRKEAHEAEKQTARSNLHSNNIGQNGDIYCKRYSVNSNDLYLDSKDSLCWQSISPLETTVWVTNTRVPGENDSAVIFCTILLPAAIVQKLQEKINTNDYRWVHNLGSKYEFSYQLLPAIT